MCPTQVCSKRNNGGRAQRRQQPFIVRQNKTKHIVEQVCHCTHRWPLGYPEDAVHKSQRPTLCNSLLWRLCNILKGCATAKTRCPTTKNRLHIVGRSGLWTASRKVPQWSPAVQCSRQCLVESTLPEHPINGLVKCERDRLPKRREQAATNPIIRNAKDISKNKITSTGFQLLFFFTVHASTHGEVLDV